LHRTTQLDELFVVELLPEAEELDGCTVSCVRSLLDDCTASCEKPLLAASRALTMASIDAVPTTPINFKKSLRLFEAVTATGCGERRSFTTASGRKICRLAAETIQRQ
jgi:hypothetical protein